MLKVIDMTEDENKVMLMFEAPEGQQIMQFFMPGVVQTYMEAYGLEAEQALFMLLGDAHIEGLDCPDAKDADAHNKALLMSREASKQIVWMVDRAPAIARMTEITDDQRRILDRQDAYVQGVKRREEEILADEIISAQPHLSKRPRDTTSRDVGLSIKFV